MEPISTRSRPTSRSTLNVTIPSEIESSDGGSLPTGGQEVNQRSEHGSRNALPHQTQPSPVLQVKQRELTEILAARAIERCWCSYRDRQMFKLLKHAICAAEHSLTHEILRKVSPKEAKLIKDPSLQARVRFRFAGSEFPPIILFKVYIQTEGSGLKYLSGKCCIKPASDAAVDACRVMGHRKFYEQLIADTCQHERDKITGEVDVTTVKDYKKYLSKLDEMPSYMGGRENLWRNLDQSVLPRTTILYDVIDYLNRSGNSPSARLRAEMPILTTRPITQEVQREHVKIISELREPLQIPIPSPTFKPPSSRVSSPGQTSRRSKQAKHRASRMRKLYMADRVESRGDNPDDEVVGTVAAAQVMSDGLEDDAEEDEWQREADQLYAWTRDLSYEDIGLTTPC